MLSGGDQSQTFNNEMMEELATYANRPRDFVYWAFPWGESGSELEHRKGPEAWQDDMLAYLQDRLLEGLLTPSQVIAEAIQVAVRSGHDVGKSAALCWITLWAVSTREDTKGVITANTEKQLRLKLWQELRKWARLFIASSLFKVTATSIQASDPSREGEWRIDAIPWSEDNPEAFQGLHNYGKRVLVIFDEASGIMDKIWETIDGVMNEAGTELLWFAFGNPTRNKGRFRDCFDRHGQGQFWKTFKVDSRSVSFTNQDRIQRAVDLWGIESDYIKVRWLGEFPESSNAQLIPTSSIQSAMDAHSDGGLHFEPLILAVDVARMGEDESVAMFRRGKDARHIPTQRWRKTTLDALTDGIANLINTYHPDAVFIDEGGMGGGPIDFLRRLGHSVIGVNFNAEPSIPLGGELAYNKRAEMYLSLRTWLREGGAIPKDDTLFRQLRSIEIGYSKAGRKPDAILLAPKEELEESPDWADALAMTFAYPVNKVAWKGSGRTLLQSEYDPFAIGALPGEVAPNRRGPSQSPLTPMWN